MDGWTTGYVPLTGEIAGAEVGESVRLPAGGEPQGTLAGAQFDLVGSGAAVVAWPASQTPPTAGTRLRVAGSRRMLHHLASAADVEIPVVLLATGEMPDADADAVLSRAMLDVLVAVS